MSKTIKGMMAAIIGLVAAAAFLLGVVIPRGEAGKVSAETATATTTQEIKTDQTSENEIIIKDSAGNEFKAPIDAKKIITLNEIAYEMMTALGKEDIVEGISQDTKFPESAVNKQKYGTESKPETDKIIEATPDAVMVSTGFVKSDEYTKLKTAGIDVIAFDLDKSDTSIEEIAKMGILFDAIDNADGFITDIENVKNLVSDKVKDKEAKKVYWELSDEYTSPGKEGNENTLLKTASLKSITEDQTSNDGKTQNQLIKEKDPDLIIKTNLYDSNILTLNNADADKAKEIIESITGREGLGEINAVKDKKIMLLSERIINTPLGSAIAPLYAAKMAYPEEMADINPGDYLKSFFEKYWSTDLKGALCYFGNLSEEENKGLSGSGSKVTADGLSSLSSLSSSPEANSSELGDTTDVTSDSSESKNNLLVKSGLGTLASTPLSALVSSASTNTDSVSNLLDKAGQNNTGNSNSGNTDNKNTENNTNVKRTDDGKIDVSDGNGPKEVVQDSRGEQIIVDKNDNSGETAVKKCIVFNSSVYEMIKILGQEDSVIGVAESMTDLNPNVPVYGTWKEPNAEAVIEAKPDVVFAYANYGQEAVAKIKNAGIAVISLNFYIPSEIPGEVLTLGKVLGAESVAEAFNQDVEAIHNLINQRTRYVSPVSAYWEGYTDYKSVGQGSGGNELLTLAHVNSLTAGESVEYPEISDEWILERKPEIIVKMVSGTKNILGPTVGNYDAAHALYSNLASRPGWNTIPAVTNKKILLLNSTVGTTAFGHAVAPLYIAKLAYPDKFSDVDADAITKEFYQKYWGESLAGTWRYYEQ